MVMSSSSRSSTIGRSSFQNGVRKTTAVPLRNIGTEQSILDATTEAAAARTTAA